MTEDNLMMPTEPQDPRYVEIPGIGKWMTTADERVWDDYDEMKAHLNAREIEDELAAYVTYLEATAKKRLSRPAVKPALITRGKYMGKTRKARPAYTPDERTIKTFIKRQTEAVKNYLVWTMQSA